ncbi:MAG: M67 family metallopeptidase [Gemmatimonadota bacterium]|nr:MAG: M67 family metallopeptidase [Gemmatimonadota bacterium]
MRSSSKTGDDLGARLVVSREVLALIRRHVEGIYPEEAPGGLLGTVHEETTVEVVEAVPSHNVRNEERRRRYLIGPDDVLALERRASEAGLQVVGYYHSHPDAPPLPSEFDREHAWPWYVYLIVSVVDGRMADARAWRLADDRDAFDAVEMNYKGLVTTGTEDK